MTSRRIIEGTCPEDRGPLAGGGDGDLVEFDCLARHRYAPEALLHAHAETQERALWSAVVALEEARKAAQVREIIPHLTPFRIV